MNVRIYKRAVMAKRATRAEAEEIATALANPIGDVEITGEYAVEWTNIANQREPWRVVHLTEVPDDATGVHPKCKYLVSSSQGQLRDGYDNWYY